MEELTELQATQKQKSMFFALCNQLGWDAETTKERVKKKYTLDSFANISKEQLRNILDVMITRTQKQIYDTLEAFFSMNTPQAFEKKEVGEGYISYPVFLTTQLLKFFEIREKKKEIYEQ